MTADPHLERVTPYSPIGRRAAVAEVAPALAGFVAALVLMPSRWQFAWGLVAAATLVATGFAADLVELLAIRRWERRNGRIVTSLLLGEGEVFYIERGAHAV